MGYISPSMAPSVITCLIIHVIKSMCSGINIIEFHYLILVRYNKVRSKGPDDICAYFDLEGN